jgi:radical SAM superfamily enzyme YgiQ (UPF0313 family)
MRILIVAPKYTCRSGEFYQFPLGLGYIISALKRSGFDVHVLNCNDSTETSGQQVVRAVRDVDPAICATGGLSPFLPDIQQIFRAARLAKPDIFNIAGGGALSSDPEAGPKVMDIDAGVIGEGEETIVELARAVQAGTDLNAVAGIVFRAKDDRVVRTRSRPSIVDLGAIAWPDYKALGFDKMLDRQLPSDNYFYQDRDRPRAIDMITSRSCPYRCTFCFHPTGKVYRERPLDDFFQELDFLVSRYDIKMVALVDELFSLKRARLLEFCERIEPYNIKWMVQLHVNCADDTTLRRMKAAGASYISYGVESMSQPVLISMQKKSKKERIHSVLHNTFEHRIGIQGNIIFGDSAESLATANESMDWWAHNRHVMIYINRLMVYPGSPDYIQAVRDGLITDRIAFIEDQDAVGINISQMNDDDLDGLTHKVALAHRTLLALAPVTAFEPQPDGVTERSHLHHIAWDCPRCDHHNDLKNFQVDPTEHYYSIRMTCRGCHARFDIRNPNQHPFEGRPSSDEDAVIFGSAQSALAEGREAEAIGLLEDLARRRVWHYPSHLLLSRIARDKGEKLAAMKHLKAALYRYPFEPMLHVAFADQMMLEGALGLARLHYQQALDLDPDYSGVEAKLADIQSRRWTDTDRATYFVSYSEKSAPARLGANDETKGLRRNEIEFPDIAQLELKAKELLSVG